MRDVLCLISVLVLVAGIGCERQTASTPSSEPGAETVATQEPVAADESAEPETTPTSEEHEHADTEEHTHESRGMMRGGPGRMGHGPGAMGGMREDMMTLHSLFDGRGKIKRTVTNLPNGAETLTESDDDQIASLLQDHVPAMEGRVTGNDPLPPMTFQPLFKELIKHADKVTFDYEETEHGIKVTYTSDDPHVVLVVQEHAKLVSRFIENGMEEIHKPYTLPQRQSNDSESQDEPK